MMPAIQQPSARGNLQRLAMPGGPSGSRGLISASMLLASLVAIAWPSTGRAEPAATEGFTSAPGLVAPTRPRFYVCAGGAFLKPFSSSRELELADVDGAASLAVQNGPIAGSGATVDSAFLPAAIVGYVLPFARRRVSIEGVLGLPFTVRFQATGTLADTSIAPMALGIPTGVGPLGSELGEATAVPLVLTATVQLIDHGAVLPYLGAGPSVLFTRDAKVTNSTLTEVNEPEMSIDPAPGLVLQGGVDLRLSKSIYARVDIKYIAFMTAHAEVKHINVKTPGLPLFDSVEVGTAKMDVAVNPLIVLAGVGFDFNLW